MAVAQTRGLLLLFVAALRKVTGRSRIYLNRSLRNVSGTGLITVSYDLLIEGDACGRIARDIRLV